LNRNSSEQPSSSHTEWAVRRLRTAITNGEVQSNEPLRAPELAQLWGISATPIREAFQRLAADGFVIHSAHRGVRVAPISIEELEELDDLRLAVEPLALARSLARADAEWSVELEAALHALRVAADTQPFDRSEYESIHREFHATLVSRAGPTWWPRIATMLRDQTARYRSLHIQDRPIPEVMSEHENLVAACLRRDADAAVAQLREHIMRSREAVLHRVMTNGFPSPLSADPQLIRHPGAGRHA
jgi:GntR family carbon starvation induced transcriptional regulator